MIGERLYIRVELGVLGVSPDSLLNVAELFCNCVIANHAIVYKTGMCLMWKTMTVPFLSLTFNVGS